MSDAAGYRFERLSTGMIIRDMYFTTNDPRPGDKMVEFDLPTLSGERFSSADLAETGPILLVFGSYTCPVTASAAPGLNDLHAKYGDSIRFVMVGVREAHPGSNMPQPSQMEEKIEHARLLKDIYGINYEVAVDDLDGTLHRALSPKPNSAYLVAGDGEIMFRAHWANDTKAIGKALEAVAAGRPVPKKQARGLIRPLWPTVRYVAPVLDRSGKGAWRDMWISALPMAFMGKLAKLFRLTPREA